MIGSSRVMILFMTRFFVLGLCLSVSGCDFLEMSDVYQVSEDFDDTQIKTMQLEADQLCVLTTGEDCLVFTRDSSRNKVELHNLDGNEIGHTSIDADDGSEYDRITITISPEGVDRLNYVFRHELGHAAGCWGHLNKGNVMYHHVSSVDWTADDLACLR